jgi:glycosyltransferase involved in cell wall biosynthesis
MPGTSSARASVVLSICIPTYNRSAVLCALVQRVLSCPAQDIEVVVLDNGSTDDTLARLANIQDSRLCVYSNGINRGALFNGLNVMLKGCGRYTVLMLDKDSLDPTHLNAFKEFLLSNDPACGYSLYHGSVDQVPEVAPAGVPALQLVGYACHHPTGYFFRTELLHELDIARRFSNADYVGHFAIDFILAECSLRGPAAVYRAPAFAPESLASAAKVKSFGTNAAKEHAFFSPEGRLKMVVNFASHISGLPVPAWVKRKLILERFTLGMVSATLGYRRLLSNEEICSHYHIAPRHIGPLEMARTGISFYRSFYKAYPSGQVSAAVKLSHASILGGLVRRLARGILRCLVRSCA